MASLAACETTNSENWVGGETTPFDRAEESCENETENIAVEENRPEFFGACMATLGWRPKASSDFATPEDAPDPVD